MPRQLTPDDARHGTAYAYVYYKCRCEPCTQANRDRCAQAQAARLTRPTAEHVHGTNGYFNYGCRCATCKTAGKEANAQGRKARRTRRRTG